MGSPHPRPPERPGRGVVVPKGLLATLVGALVGCLIAVAYLVGRESGRRSLPPAPWTPDRGVEVAGTSAPAAPTLPAVPDPGTGFQPSTSYPAAAPPPAAVPYVPPPVVTAYGGGGGAPDASAVARYFTEVEAIESQAKTWSDPTALANTLLKQAIEGDMSGFDSLIESQRAVRTRLAGVATPEVCQEHHQRTIAALDAAMALLARMRDGIAAQDITGLALFATQAQALERQAKDVDALATSIKRRYGLTS